MRATIGLIGYGRFGRLAAFHLARHADIVVFDRGKRVRARGRHIRAGSLAEAAGQPYVVLAVPISALRPLLKAICPHVRKGAVVFDVSSVKVLPLRWMMQHLPPYVSIIGTHPLFGPDSDTGSLEGQHLVVCPGRVPVRTLRRIRGLGRMVGLRLRHMTPADHDRLMADSLLLTHYVGRLMRGAKIAQRGRSTASYDHLKELVRIAGNDSAQLFRDMWRHNPYGSRLLGRLSAAHRAVARTLGPVR